VVAGLRTTTEYTPASSTETLASESVGPLAPGMAMLFFCHSKVSGAEPNAFTLNTAGWPAATTSDAGCDSIVTATGAAETITEARLLRVLPKALETMTW